MTEAINWLNRLISTESTNQMHSFLLEHYPSLALKDLKKIIILGAADEGLRLASLCNNNNINVEAIADDNAERVNSSVCGLTVQNASLLANADKRTPVIIASHRCLSPFKKLKEMGFKTVAPFAVLQALYPEQFPEHMFYKDWLKDLFDNKDQIIELSTIFKDKKSQETLNAQIAFRMTLNPEYLEPVIDLDVYNPKDIIQLSENEVYVDGGSFDGDSINMFIQNVESNFDKIYGFEPDTNTFKKLELNFKNQGKVVPVNKGLFSRNTTLHFDNAGTRASIFSENETSNSLSLPVTDLDSFLSGDRVTYIKMNIEGAEIEALKGASSTIKKWKPKLAISMYHRPTDLWHIASLIKELCSEYDLYLRQQDGGVIEGVIYAVTEKTLAIES